MHIALIVDAARAGSEQPWIQHIAADLGALGATVSRFLPESEAPDEADEEDQPDAGVFHYPPAILPWRRRARSAQIASLVEKTPPDVVCISGADAWRVGLEFAQAIDKPASVIVSQLGEVRGAARTGGVSAFVAASQPIADELRQRVEPGLVGVVPPGVELPEAPRSILEGFDQSVGCAIVGENREVECYRPLLTALREISGDLPQLRFFLELRGPRTHDIWRLVRDLDMLDLVSAITDAADHRPLLTRCDILIRPEPSGVVRTVVLEAMAAGLLVVAAPDPAMDALRSGETAAIVDDPTTTGWAKTLRELLSDHHRSRALGAAARRYVAEHHDRRREARELLDLHERTCHGGAFSFAQARGTASD